MKKNLKLNGETVLITGASSGIGYELSKLFAQDGYNLVLVSRNEKKLTQVMDELKENFDIKIKIIPKDLSIAESPREIFDELQQESIKIDVLVNNAGAGLFGYFSETDITKELQIIQTNVISLTHLTKLFLPEMLKQRYGKILNVGSVGSFVPNIFSAVYGATKSYILSFSEALSGELQGTGVKVTVLCPGRTKTNFHKKAEIENINYEGMDSRIVAKIGYRSLLQEKIIVIPGISNKLKIFLTRFMPRSLIAKIARKLMNKKLNK